MLPDPALLRACLARARQPLPQGCLRLRLAALKLGWIAPARAEALLRAWPDLRATPGALAWWPDGADAGARSACIQAVAERLAAAGLIGGWRNEAYACEAPVDDPLRLRGAELFRLERAAFRFFGLMSRAVHINARWPDGRILCGRRALTKATDPGALDNLAAGGLRAGEGLLDCARRELWEEAGVPPELTRQLRACGALRSTRVEPEGLHDEILHVFELQLPADFSPRNQDGEVSEFLALDAGELQARLAAGEFSPDAASAIAYGMLGANSS
ncbi:NUDIX hydrolase [Paucibacter soli]|uniref:NUDIX hydrolase n=1 Tax=Paucibacter soli TaxID=3133433 RepID=UPI00309C7218